MRYWLVLVVLGLAAWPSGCAPVPAGRSLSIGAPARGYFRSPVALPAQGPGFRSVRERAAAFGTARMIAYLQRVARTVKAAKPVGPDIRVGDISLEGGGRIDGHGSHRAGRDVDLLYFARDAAGAPADVGAMRFDRFGQGSIDGARYRFDTQRNWAFVRALLTDTEVEVQWIFCSHGVKVLLLEEALAQGEDLELVRRAAWILHRPTNARPHDDHMHVRIFCSAEERTFGCLDGAPDWDWRPRGAPSAPSTDAEILAALAADSDATATIAGTQ